jgi:hypothetical protein
VDQIRSIQDGSEDDAILGFNHTHKALKEAIQRAAELEQVLIEPRLLDLRRAQTVVRDKWPFLQYEQDLPDSLSQAAEALSDLLQRETFFRELPAIEQHTSALENEHRIRFQKAVEERVAAYSAALDTLHGIDGWHDLNEDQQALVAGPLETRSTAEVPEATGIPFLRSERDACGQYLKAAIQQMLELIEGNLLVTVEIGDHFSGKVETPEQLEASIASLKQRVEKLIGEGKKVLIR